ncbi:MULTISPECIES: L-glutamate gamma-semialdehyde dehydrogenase [unclassified Arcicella]|uniref:L-glutamate gamma-semialdehyde dehydrogenase n=1 Tax=unclassified Arcicella TaxID=2644986 RepID=UPI002859AEEA|nr:MULTISPECIES: L-glutamate gamma-semialdehyde dehydrogenase [unclassified Arcicella]MDR6564421.1 1-pyrroline-5-carboxylate dehydrogenase [Arcicella sp. BE51]MDR6814280.1 1-pyrroline-5-carboxylate dehydrogenase [Arcicella sp. BE140]MDR6825698.1 1-pyrroline-5-carboxylate dehydrogenase [Arcicella sp. BE139]
MSTGFFSVPTPKNEPINSYAPNTKERETLIAKLTEMRGTVVDVPMYIGSEEIRTGNKQALTSPHDHQHILGYYHEGDASHVNQAIDSALSAREAWASLPWENRMAVFLKAADLSATKYRNELNASTMLGQSKNAYQAEIDAACEWIDFLRFNVHFATQIYAEQPISSENVWNKLEYRPLEGFVFAVTPFNFTAIAGNLPASAALMGNVVVWKPSPQQIYSANVLMKVLKEAGLPDGVINLIYTDGPLTGDIVFKHPQFAGVHFTGSTKVFQHIWKTIGENIHKYKSYPRIVGETGGKDFVVAHKSADAKALAVGLVRGAFEYQGQKCSAASRAYIPNTLWEQTWEYIQTDLAEIKVGGVEDFSNFVNAVIDEKAFDKIAGYIDNAKASDKAKIIAGGNYDKSKGYFIEPTIILTEDPHYTTMSEEIFGPVLTIYVYDAEKYEETLDIVNTTSDYALTGAIFAQDRYALEIANKKLVNAAGNFYINDKPTGAVVGQQPFGGARASGTNDKAGSMLNLLRWVSPRTIKETFVSPTDYKYPFLG